MIAAESSEPGEYDQDEAGDIINHRPKISVIKDHLNTVIKYIEDINDENTSAYYEHLRHLHEILKKLKRKTTKDSSFFKPVSMSSVVNEGVP